MRSTTYRPVLIGGLVNTSPGDAEIFISYRRDDSAAPVRALTTELVKAFGPRSVYLDVDSIQPGRAYAAEIGRQLANASVALIVIGPAWLTAADEHGRRRLLDPGDLVRMEVEAALHRSTRDMLVIPILIDGTPMPDTDQLPPSLGPLSGLNGARLRNTDWTSDINRLVSVIGARVPRAGTNQTAVHQRMPVQPTASQRPSPRQRRSRTAGVLSGLFGLVLFAAMVAAVGVGGYLLFGLVDRELLGSTDLDLNPSSGPPGTEVEVTATGYPPGEEVIFRAFFGDINGVVVANAEGTAVWRVVLPGGFGPNTERITAQSEGLSDQSSATFVYSE